MSEEKDNSKLSSIVSWMCTLYQTTSMDKQQPPVFYNLVNQPDFAGADSASITQDQKPEDQYGVLIKKLKKIKENSHLGDLSKISSYIQLHEYNNDQEKLDLYFILSGKKPTGNKLSVLEELELLELVSFSCGFLALFDLYPKLGNLYQQTFKRRFSEYRDIADRSQINIVLDKFENSLKSGEFSRFSGADNSLTFDSCTQIQKQQAVVKSLKQRKIEDHFFVLGRQLGKTNITREYIESFYDKMITESELSAKHIQSKAEFKKSPLERLNKKKAVKTATVSPLLKGLMGKT